VLTLQALQSVGEDVWGDAGDLRLELVESARADEQCLHDEQAPSVADALEGGAQRRISGHERIVRHRSATSVPLAFRESY
jgi:hypothetical protein